MFRTKSHLELLSKLNEGVIELDRHLKVKYINAKAARQLNIQENVVGLPLPPLGILQAKIRHCLEHQVTLAELYEGLEIKITPHNKGILLVIDRSQNLGKEFIANASHELRTPITIIKGFAEMLSDMPEISTTMLSEITEKIIRNCHRMNHLVKSLLTLADLDNIHTLTFERCDLISLIDRCSHALLSLYPDAHIETLTNQSEVTILANAGLLELCVNNLLENAVKYSAGEAKITITIESKKESVKVAIADRGVGIPDNDLPHIFDRFYTVNKAHSRKLGGAGLGLSIVKAIVEKNGGAISVVSTIGEGTTFTMIFSSAQ